LLVAITFTIMTRAWALISIIAIVGFGCKQHASRTATESCAIADFGFADSSSNHPRASTYKAMAEQLVDAGIPGISIMIQDSAGLWFGAYGKADLQSNTSMQPCHREYYKVVYGNDDLQTN
jgi:hypothetical protein